MNKLKSMLLLGILLFSNLGSIFSINAYAEEGRDVTSNVTSLSVSPSNVKDGEKFTVNLKFDEKAIDIQSGDYIKVSWPRNGEIYGAGFNKSIDLLIQGKNVGKLNVTTDGAIIVFNDNIRNLDDVEGWAQFEIQARNLTNTSEENTGNLTIISGNKTAVVAVTKPASGTGPSVFYYKTGDMLPEDTDHVRWFLNINNNKSYVEQEVRVLDEIQPGQVLDPSSFEIVVDSPTGRNVFRGAEGVTNFLAAYPRASFYYSVPENKIIINLPENITNLTSFSISYKTIISNPSQTYFDNHSKAWFKEYNQPAVTGEEFNYSVENIDVSGGVNGTVKGELKIVKNIQGTEIGIPHVQFELKRIDGGLIQGQKSIILETDEQGITGIKKLAVGDYVVKEVHAPDWIDFDLLATKEIKFTMTDQDTSGASLNISNEKKKISITGNKVWEGGETPRPTVYLKLYRSIGTGSQLDEVPNVGLGELKDGNLSFTWNNLEQYDNYGNEYQYSVKEVDKNGTDFVPEGYTKIENGLTVINKNIEQISIQGIKTWNDQDNQDGKRPEKIKVNLLADGKVVATKEVSEVDGWKYTFENLPKYKNGQVIVYTVTEDQVADYNTEIKGYDIINNYTPGKTSVSVTKAWDDKNNQDGLRPNSVKVQLYANGKVEGEAVELNTGNQWSHTWNDLPEKSKGQSIVYTVKEATQIPGYTEKVDDSNLGNVKITNTHIPEVMKISGQKTWNDQDNQDGKRPEKIKVNLLADGKVVATKEVSEVDGWKYTFENLPKYKNGQVIVYTV
ncbi:Cna B-type domain-containing protein, partial [Lactococcus petauri]|uniref:Cna B-type domain-containing protein n=1 Tax=Lactococcus petauri TaxID=1940789 RepID=UPI0038528032